MTVLLIIILFFYLIYILAPYILAFVGKRMIRRMQQNFDAASGADRSRNKYSKRTSRNGGSSASSPQHEKIFTADEGQYVDFEEV